jgi:VanZ family protein
VNFPEHIKRNFSKIYIAVAWTLMVIILLCIPGTMLPSEQGFSIPDFDKFVHIVLFGMLVFLWCFYLSTKNYHLKKLMILFFLVFLFSCALGISMEFIQKCCVPFRDYSEGDIIADMIGASIGYGICNIFLSAENNSP